MVNVAWLLWNYVVYDSYQPRFGYREKVEDAFASSSPAVVIIADLGQAAFYRGTKADWSPAPACRRPSLVGVELAAYRRPLYPNTAPVLRKRFVRLTGQGITHALVASLNSRGRSTQGTRATPDPPFNSRSHSNTAQKLFVHTSIIFSSCHV